MGLITGRPTHVVPQAGGYVLYVLEATPTDPPNPPDVYVWQRGEWREAASGQALDEAGQEELNSVLATVPPSIPPQETAMVTLGFPTE